MGRGDGMSAWHRASVTRWGNPDSAWLAEIFQDDEDVVASAWRSEKAAKDWVKRQLAETFGIERKRLPWKRTEYHGAIEYRLEWEQGRYEDFKGWGVTA
jgi:hypothetical protein